MQENICYFWISRIGDIDFNTFKYLLEKFGTLSDLWNAKENEITSCGINPKIADKIISTRNEEKVYSWLDELKKHDVKCITYLSKKYPENFREIDSPPLVIYHKGKLPKKQDVKISIVGTRKCSDYGRIVTYNIAKDLAKKGIVVVSGMARGIDSKAHEGALDAEGQTLAVLGCGIDICYPAENRELMDRIIENGCIISEFPLGTRPYPANFPRRNRLISAFSQGVVVTEADNKSGSLITVNFALDQGKEVYAVPGNITSRLSEGTNSLIRDGAVIVTSANDILENINKNYLDYPNVKESNNMIIENSLESSIIADNKEEAFVSNNERIINRSVEENSMDNLYEENNYGNSNEVTYEENNEYNLEVDEKTIFNLLSLDPESVENIIKYSGFEVSSIQYILTTLEMNGFIKQLPGNRYIKNVDFPLKK